MKRLIILVPFLSFLVVFTYGQTEKWSLEKCVEYALENSLTIESGKLAIKDADLVSNSAWQERLPSINGSSGYNLSFGRRIDPSTNDFINQRFGNQTISVSGGVVLFNGGRVNNQIKQSKLQSEAARMDLEQMENDISLEVAQTYLNILFSKENAANARNSLALTQNQLDQIERLIAAGSRPRNAALELVAQVAAGEQALIMAENDAIIGLLTLRQLLQLDPTTDFEIETPEVVLPSDYDMASLNSEDVYASAESNQPSIKAGDLRARSAEIGVALAKTNHYPSLSIGGSLGSNFSSVAARQGEITGGMVVDQPGVFINGEPVMFGFFQPTFTTDKISYGDQLNENFGYGVGVQLDVPIFNQGRNKVARQQAELNVRRVQVDNLNIKNNLRSTIERSVADAKAAKLQYDAALRTLEASRASYGDTQKRYDLGVSNSFELTTAINNRDQAEVDLLIAKYDFIFKLKVIDFYQGKAISLN